MRCRIFWAFHLKRSNPTLSRQLTTQQPSDTQIHTYLGSHLPSQNPPWNHLRSKHSPMGSKVNTPVDQICINNTLTDDDLIAILSKLKTQEDKDVFGLVCKRWLFLQSSQRKKLCVRSGPHMLQRMAARFTNLHHLDMSQSVNRSFYPGVSDSDLYVIASSFGCLRNLELRDLKGLILCICFLCFVFGFIQFRF